MNGLVLAFITGLTAAAFLIGGLLFVVMVVRKRIISFITSPDDKTPSGLAVVTDAIALVISKRITEQLKASFLGIQSGAARGQAALERDIVTDMVSQKSPLLGGILSQYPNVVKRIAKNPGLVEAAMSFINGLGSKPGAAAGGNGSKPPPQLELFK